MARKKKANGGSVEPPTESTESETTAKEDLRTLSPEQKALLKKGKEDYKVLHKSYRRHCVIRDCLKVLMDKAMEVTGANSNRDKRYQNRYSEYLKEYGWDTLEETYRLRLQKLTPEHDAWWEGLPEHEQFHCRGPQSVLDGFEAHKKKMEEEAAAAAAGGAAPTTTETQAPDEADTLAAELQAAQAACDRANAQTGKPAQGEAPAAPTDDSEEGDGKPKGSKYEGRLDDWKEDIDYDISDAWFESESEVDSAIEAAKSFWLAKGVSEEDFDVEVEAIKNRISGQGEVDDDDLTEMERAAKLEAEVNKATATKPQFVSHSDEDKIAALERENFRLNRELHAKEAEIEKLNGIVRVQNDTIVALREQIYQLENVGHVQATPAFPAA